MFPTDEETGRLAGRLLGQTGGTNTVDALLAAEAARVTAHVLTSDPDDLLALLVSYPAVSVIALSRST